MRRRRRTVALVSSHAMPFASPGIGRAGGMNVVVSQLAYGFARAGVAVDVFTHHTGRQVVAQHLGQQLRLIAVPSGGAVRAHAALEIPAKYDVVHSHYWQSLPLALALSDDNTRLLQTFHTLETVKAAHMPGYESRDARTRAEVEYSAAGLADCVLVATTEEAVAIRRLRPSARIFSAPPGVPTLPPTAGGQCRPRGKRSGRPIRLVAVARIEPAKGLGLAIRALAALRESGILACLTIVGGPSGPDGASELASLRALARAAGVECFVRFVGPQAYRVTAAIVRTATAVLVSSHTESFGLAAVEARQAGVGVVGTAVGVLPELANDGGAVVVPSRDPDTFAGAIEQMVNRSPTESTLFARGYAAAHSLQASFQRHREAYGI